MSSTPLEALAGFAAALQPADLPAEVARSVRERVLDTVGICLAATRLDTSAMALRVARSWGAPGPATVIGYGERLPVPGAAFVNGVLAHSLDFDDTHLPSILHPSASILPTVLAVGESLKATTSQVAAAAAAGYEVCVRTGMAAFDRKLGNSVFFERGWHATSICGTLGSAVAAAKLMGLDAGGIGHALAIATSMGAGILEGNRTGGSVKRAHCGWAAHAGVVAAQCAAAGITGPRTALEGRFGFYQAFCGGQFDPAEILDGLGTRWSVPSIFFKPYPANHFTHAAVDAALRLRGSVAPEDIESMELGVPRAPMRTIAEPREEKIRPRSGYQAQFSGPFAVAAALLGGGGLGLGLDDFTDEKANDPRYRSLAAKVMVHHEPELDTIFPFQFPAVLRIRTRGGELLEARVLVNRGGPDNPLSADELGVKFEDNVRRVLDPDQAAVVAETLLDTADRPVSELFAAIRARALPASAV